MGNALSSYIRAISNKDVLIPLLRSYLAKQQHDLATGKLSHRQAVIDDAQMTIRCFQERIDTYTEVLDDEGMFHPSALGHCQRAAFFHHFAAPDNGVASSDDLLRSHVVFEFGTYMHVLIQNLCEAAGILEKREVGIVSKKERTMGHADGILLIDKIRELLEIKTINAEGFAKLTGPLIEHKIQTTDYMHCLGLQMTRFLYIDKNRHGMREYAFPYSQSFWEKEVKGRKDKISGQIARKELPAREGANPNVFPCRFCQFSKVCFVSKDLDKFMCGLKKPVKLRFAKKG